jgi:outer membrane protein TolC
LPTLTLSASGGRVGTEWSDLQNNSGLFWNGGADLSVPLFSGGSSWFGRKAAIDAYQASLATYRQVVLNALQQVADSLRALEHDAESLRAAADGLAAARAAFGLTQANYQAGLADYLAVLIATSQYQSAQLSYTGAVAQRLQDSVALFVALGGGWWNAATPLPTTAPQAAIAQP